MRKCGAEAEWEAVGMSASREDALLLPLRLHRLVEPVRQWGRESLLSHRRGLPVLVWRRESLLSVRFEWLLGSVLA